MGKYLVTIMLVCANILTASGTSYGAPTVNIGIHRIHRLNRSTSLYSGTEIFS